MTFFITSEGSGDGGTPTRPIRGTRHTPTGTAASTVAVDGPDFGQQSGNLLFRATEVFRNFLCGQYWISVVHAEDFPARGVAHSHLVMRMAPHMVSHGICWRFCTSS